MKEPRIRSSINPTSFGTRISRRGVHRYKVSDPPIFSGGLHDPSDIGQSGFRNPLGGGPIFMSFTNMGLVLLLGVLCS